MLRFTMATVDKKRSTFFSPVKLDIRMHPYSENKHICRENNMAAAVKMRELASEKFAAQVNM